jgi:hypothetical protein
MTDMYYFPHAWIYPCCYKVMPFIISLPRQDRPPAIYYRLDGVLWQLKTSACEWSRSWVFDIIFSYSPGFLR